MTFFDEDSSKQPEQHVEPAVSVPEATVPPSNELGVAPPAGDHFSGAPSTPLKYAQRPEVPDDLRISWSWLHVLCFVVFGVISLVAVQTVFAFYYAPHKSLPQKELEQYLFSIPQFIVGSNVVWFGVVLLFLYVSLSVLPGGPFWQTVGWRKFSSTTEAIHSNLPTKPWLYFLFGCGLSLITAIAGSRVHAPDDMPIEALLKSRAGAMLMMSMAVLVAPLVEETVFRGYLYPVFVRMISGVARWFGVEATQAIRIGVSSSILVTGLLFGMLHGAQLAWTWGIVTLLIFVGIAFTYVRARTGTVFASYLMHLGYNSLIAFATIVGTHGFTKMPPHP
jgi:membrane protease YdiL (CAAX protease family)